LPHQGLLFRSDKAQAIQNAVGPPAGIELHRKGHKLEKHCKAEEENAKVHQRPKGKEKAKEKERKRELGPKPGSRNKDTPEGKGRIPLTLLKNMPHLMGDDGKVSHRSSPSNRPGKSQGLPGGIVVVRQSPRDFFDLHPKPEMLHEFLRYLETGKTHPGPLPGKQRIGLRHLGMSVQGKKKRRNEY
jgi:hypothetical protein